MSLRVRLIAINSLALLIVFASVGVYYYYQARNMFLNFISTFPIPLHF